MRRTLFSTPDLSISTLANRKDAMNAPSLRLIGLVLAALFGGSAQAAIYTVGGDAACTHGTIQSAINAANSSGTTSLIRVSRSLTYTAAALTINTPRELTIEGGYADCTQATPDATHTLLSGAGAHAPVFTITAPTGGLIHLRNLDIKNGSVDGAGQGGGIRFSGNGILELQNSTVSNNIAGYGGGIYATGTGTSTELVIGADVVISNNTARYDGGGVYADGLEMSMVDAGNSSILLNTAQGLSGDTGYGGGLYVTAQTLSSYAYIGSGAPGFGAINLNHARYGGGVAVGGQSQNGSSKVAQLQLFSTQAGYPGSIQNNDASVAGGAIHLRSGNSGNITASAQLWNASLLNNSAPDGAAVMLTGSGSADFSVNASILNRDDAVPCPVGTDCGRIESNTTGGTASGAVIRSTLNGDIELGGSFDAGTTVPRHGVFVRNNTGKNLILASGGSGTVGAANAVIGSNTAGDKLIERHGGNFTLIDTTLAGNTIGGLTVIDGGNANVKLTNSILWQPGKTLLSYIGGTYAGSHLVASESFNLGPMVTVFDPRFNDPAHGDYGLRAGSDAVDFSLVDSAPAAAVDALGQPRNIDLPVKYQYLGVPNGIRDVGAFERQSLQPLVLNNDFDVDLRVWDVVTAGSTSRDATHNTTGAANSGSAHVSATNLSTSSERLGISQCIHLPGPAVFELNGWGRGTGTQVVGGDRANLHWEYRRNGGENCTGTPDGFGTLTLSNGPSWRRAAEPALIEVTGSNWGDSPSIKVILAAQEFGASGTTTTDAWFDGITLEVQLSDRIFADGFEP